MYLELPKSVHFGLYDGMKQNLSIEWGSLTALRKSFHGTFKIIKVVCEALISFTSFELRVKSKYSHGREQLL